MTVLLGSLGPLVSPLPAPLDASLLWVELAAGDVWDYKPPPSHNVAWCFAQGGDVEVSDQQLSRELVIFEEGSGGLHFRAVTGCGFLLGSAAKHPHDLVLGTHSVHTSEQALNIGLRRIAEIGQALRARGKL